MSLYVKRMIRTRSNSIFLKSSELLQWLSNLAAKMLSTNQTIFFIEEIQPNWLETPNQLRRFRRGTILFGSVVGFVFSLIGQLHLLFRGWATFFFTLLAFAPITALVGAIVCKRGLSSKINPVELIRWRPHWSWKGVRRGLSLGVLLGVGILLIGCVLLFVRQIGGESSFESDVLYAAGQIVVTVLFTLIVALLLAVLGGITGSTDRKWFRFGILGGMLIGAAVFVVEFLEFIIVTQLLDNKPGVDLGLFSLKFISQGGGLWPLILFYWADTWRNARYYFRIARRGCGICDCSHAGINFGE